MPLPTAPAPDHDDRARGQIVVLFALVIVLLMAISAVVVDYGMLRRTAGVLAGGVDAGALAGGAQLPATASNAATITASAVTYLNLNHGGLNADSTWVSYRCLVGLKNGLPDASQIPTVCDPGSPANLSANLNCTVWRCGDGVAAVACTPTGTNICNIIVVAGNKEVPYGFGPAIGINSQNTGTISSAACKGACGGPPTGPVDVALVMDRTGSMSGADTVNAKAAANSIVSLYDPANQWLALGTLGPSQSAGCAAAPAGSIGTANAPADLRRWVPVGLSGTGAANPTYTQLSAAITCYANSSTGTDLADPVTMAAYELTHNGRAGIKKGMILETDGQPNAAVGAGPNYCAQADAAATAAKGQGIEVFTIGFGLDAASGGDPACPDTTGAFKGKTATALLASMSTQPTLGATSCAAAENTDGDHFFCQPKSADLTSIFQVVAAKLSGGAHLISLP